MALVERLLELRGQIQNPDRWMLRHLFGTETKSGVDVDADRALEGSAILAAVRRISGDVGATPLKLMQREGRNREVAREHSVHKLLTEQPNPEQSPMEFREMVTSFSLTSGTGYAEIVRDGGAEVKELWPLVPTRVVPFRASESGKLAYFLLLKDGGKRVIPAENMLAIRGLSRDGILGLDTITKMRESIGLTLAMEEFAARFFRGGTSMPGFLKFPGKFKDEKARDRLSSDWNKLHSGLRNMHRLAILEEGMEWVATGVPPGEAQMIESRRFGVTETSRYFLIPPHLIGDLERATFTNVEQQFLEYLSLTLRHWFVRWEQWGDLRLLLPSERADGFYLKHQTSSLLMAVTKERYESYRTGINNGFLSPNDVRELEDMNPFDGGDVYVLPINLGPVADLDTEPTSTEGAGEGDEGNDDEDPPPGARAAWFELRASSKRSLRARIRLRNVYLALLEQAISKVVKREHRKLTRLLAILRTQGLQSFEREIVRLYQSEIGPYLYRQLEPIVRVYGEAVYREAAEEAGGELKPDATFDPFVKKYTDNVVWEYQKSSRNQIADLVTQNPDIEVEELAGVLGTRFEEWEATRAGKLAARHTVEAESAIAKFAFLTAGLLTITWITFGKNCDLCNELDGRTASIGGSFVKKGEKVDPGGETAPLKAHRDFGNPPLHEGCDCGLSIG